MELANLMKVAHLVTILGLFLAFGISLVSYYLENAPQSLKKAGAALHGIFLLLVGITGIGLVHATHVTGSWPHWLKSKAIIWVLLGAIVPLMKRRMISQYVFAFLLFGLALAAVHFAIFKP